MVLTIELYGRLRDAGFGGAIELDAPMDATSKELLDALKRRFGEKSGLLEGAVLATAESVLASGDRPETLTLAALPPVCGG